MKDIIFSQQEGAASVSPVQYNDRAFRITAMLSVALFVTTYGGDGLSKALLTPVFYLELIVTLLFTAILVEWISFATRRLDRYYDWVANSIRRISIQLLIGVFVPGLVEFLLAAAYFRYFGINILETTYLNFAFPLVMLLILMFNFYYASFYIFLRWRQDQQNIGRIAGQLRSTDAIEEPGYFTVPFGGDKLDVLISEILYFYRDGKNNYVRTKKGDTYMIPQTLDEVEKTLNEGVFFRLNRQVISNFVCCKSYSDAGYGKLQIELSPPCPLPGPTIISQRKAPKFKGWMERVGVVKHW